MEQKEARTDLTVVIKNESIFEKDTLKSNKISIENSNASALNALTKSYNNVSFAGI